MIEYKILSSYLYALLAAEVEEHLNNGWKLHGELKVVVVEQYQPDLYQALTKGNPNA